MNMYSVDIITQKNALKEEAKTLIQAAKSEIRALTDTERQRVNEIKAELNTLNEELRKLSQTVEVQQNIENHKTKSNITLKMNDNFSLLRAVRNVAENKMQDSVSQAVIDNGAKEARAAGINAVGQIQIPMAEEFRTVTVATEHDDVIATDMMNVLEPLHAKNVLIQSGVKFLSGLKGDVQYPVMSSVNASWESETATTSASTPTFSNVKLTPHRLSVVVPISKQFLVQDSTAAEQAIRNEIVNCISAKLESTVFDSSTASSTRPLGLFSDADASVGTISTFANICGLEAAIETANMNGFSYVASPSAKAAIRGMAKGSNTAASVWNDGEIDGVSCLTTSHITGKKLLCADWSQFVLAQFGNLDITVDNVTLAADGCIRLIVNSYWDFKPLRSGAYKWGTLA